MSRLGRFDRAEILDIDNSILHRTGRRVRRRGNAKNTEMDTLQAKAIDSLSDVEDLFEFYSLPDINDIGQLEEYRNKVEAVKRNFRRIHAHLKNSEGAEIFSAKYTYYEKYMADLNTALKGAMDKMVELKNLPDNKTGQPIVDMQLERERAKLKSDRRFFFQQADWELKEYGWDDLVDIFDIKCGITKFENRLESFFKLCSDIEFNFTEHEMAELGFKDQNDKLIENFKAKIVKGKQRLITVKNELTLKEKETIDEQARLRDLAESERAEKAKIAEEQRVDDLLNCAENLHFEIKTRFTTFKGKCMVDVSNLNDFEILNLKKHEENLHVELRELIDKVSGFEKFVIPCGEKANKLRKDVLDWRDKGATYL